MPWEWPQVLDIIFSQSPKKQKPSGSPRIYEPIKIHEGKHSVCYRWTAFPGQATLGDRQRLSRHTFTSLLHRAFVNERNLGWVSLYILIQTTWKDGASLCSNRSITLISYMDGEQDHSSRHSWSPVGCRIQSDCVRTCRMTIHEPDLAIPLWPKPKQPSSVCLIFQRRFWRESPYNDKHFEGQNSVGGVT